MKIRFSFFSYIIYGEMFKSLYSQFLQLLPNGCFTLLSVFLTYRIVDVFGALWWVSFLARFVVGDITIGEN